MGRLFSTRVPRPFNGERGRNKDKVINYERILINLISFGKKMARKYQEKWNNNPDKPSQQSIPKKATTPYTGVIAKHF